MSNADHTLAMMPRLVSDAGLEWQDRGVCAQTDPEAFYPSEGARGEPGKGVCRGCPVRVECLASAFFNGEQWGIWGGITERDRRPGKVRVNDGEDAMVVAAEVIADQDDRLDRQAQAKADARAARRSAAA